MLKLRQPHTRQQSDVNYKVLKPEVLSGQVTAANACRSCISWRADSLLERQAESILHRISPSSTSELLASVAL